jgi:hypothetical protein
MSKTYRHIDDKLAAWIRQQHMFFVATAPLSADGHINASPKGGDSFRVLGPTEVAYHDYTGSGAETVAHLRENGRIIIMFCAFEGSPRIARLHGRGIVIAAEHARYAELAAHFPEHPGTRSFIHITVTRVATSCGYSVPQYEFKGRRDKLERWATTQGPKKLAAYRAKANRHSIDGLPALPGQA